MLKNAGKTVLLILVTALIAGLPAGVSAQLRPQVTVAPTTNDPSLKTTPARRRNVVVSLNGILTTVDKAAKTIGVQEKTNHVIQITAQTKITKDKKPATLADGVVGEKVTGTYQRGADGKLIADAIAFGGAVKAPATPASTTN